MQDECGINANAADFDRLELHTNPFLEKQMQALAVTHRYLAFYHRHTNPFEKQSRRWPLLTVTHRCLPLPTVHHRVANRYLPLLAAAHRVDR